MGRSSALRIVDPVLTNLAYGYTNAEFVSEALFPFAQVDKEGVKIPKFGREHFMLYNTERALRAASNQIVPTDIGTVSVTLTEHDLAYPIDYREESEAMFPLQAWATNMVMSGVRLRREVIAAGIATNPANYAASNKVTLSGTGQFSDPASDPQAVIETAKEAIRKNIVRQPNTMVIGAAAWAAMKRNPQLKGLLATDRTRLVRLNDLQDIFDIPNIVIGNSVQVSDANVSSDVWGDSIVLAYVPGASPNVPRTPYEPGYGYTLRKGMPEVDTYVTEGGKIQFIRATEIFQPYLLGAEAGYLISDVVA